MIRECLDLRFPMLIDGVAGLIISAEPRKQLLSLFLGIFHGVMDIHKPGAAIQNFPDLLHVVFLNNGMPAAAVHEENQSLGALQCFGILGPAVAGHHWEYARILFEQLHEKRAAGEKFMLARTMTLSTRH